MKIWLTLGPYFYWFNADRYGWKICKLTSRNTLRVILDAVSLLWQRKKTVLQCSKHVSIGMSIQMHTVCSRIFLASREFFSCWVQLHNAHFSRRSNSFLKCVVPENNHTPTTEGIGNSKGGGAQRPRKFQRGWGLHDRFSFQRSFESIQTWASI